MSNICLVKEPFHTWESFPLSKNVSTHVKEPFQAYKSFPRSKTFPRMQSSFLSERELDCCQHKNKCVSCLTTNQLKTQYLKKLKTFKKIHEILGIKRKSEAGRLKNFDNYILKLHNFSQEGLFYLISRIYY